MIISLIFFNAINSCAGCARLLSLERTGAPTRTQTQPRQTATQRPSKATCTLAGRIFTKAANICQRLLEIWTPNMNQNPCVSITAPNTTIKSTCHICGEGIGAFGLSHCKSQAFKLRKQEPVFTPQPCNQREHKSIGCYSNNSWPARPTF